MLWLLFVPLVLASYNEQLTLQPLARNTLLAKFDFSSFSPNFPLLYSSPGNEPKETRHYGYFPQSIAPVIQSSNTRDLHLRFTQGMWDAESWGKLPSDGVVTGGTGVEIWATIEAPDVDEAKLSWGKLTESLSGFFCASLNFVDDAITTIPQYRGGSNENNAAFVTSSNHLVFLFRAALPDEPICTENLTPFLKMLPTRGKAGLASLLDGHKLYDSIWHSMSVDVTTTCSSELADSCRLFLEQHIHHIVDVQRLLRRNKEGGIPKPVPGDELRCDSTKYHDAWHCFPADDEVNASWELRQLYGRLISGAAFENDAGVSKIRFDVHPGFWLVEQLDGDSATEITDSEITISGPREHNFRLTSPDARKVLPVDPVPVLVSRSLTGYSQDKGGMRINFQNPSNEGVSLLYSEALPWFMSLYLHTMQLTGSGLIQSKFYKPAIDRSRPNHLELSLFVPAGESLTITYQFDKSLLLYAEYPPDANHGFAVAPAVVKVVDDVTNNTVYQLRTPLLLLTLPTPDFSMPYNVIILTCTVMSLAFGCIFNLLTKKVVTEAEFEEGVKLLPLNRLKAAISALRK